jgi:hypothetical protein
MAFPSTVDALVDGPGNTVHASHVLGPQRITVGPTMYNVMSDQYGPADPTGITNSSTAIANTEAAAAAAGGEVYFPAGTFLVSGVNLDTKVHWRGAGEDATILKLPNGANTFIVQSQGFAGLTGSNGTGGVTNCSISNMSLDGNKANNGSATVPVVRLYGFGYRLGNLRIRNGKNEGLYSEWSTSLPSPGGDSMESFLDNIKVHDCDSHGVHWNGPHDSAWAKGIVYNNGGRGVWIDTKGNDFVMLGVHSWGLTQTYPVFFGASGCVFGSGCVAEGGITAQVGVDANDCTIDGFIFGSGASVPVGVVIGVSGSVAGTRITTKINNCTSGGINFLNDGGSLVMAEIFQTSGSGSIGTVDANSLVMLLVTGGGTGSLLRMPTTFDVFGGRLGVHAGNPLRLYNAADSGWAELSFDGTQLVDTWPLFVPALRRTRQAKSFATPEATDPTQGGIVSMTLTANLTVNNPTQTLAGQEIIYVWTQDATGGRTITYSGANFAAGGGAAIVTTASTSTIDHFVCDGTKWRLKSRITGQ